jgi:hypothetical protein
MRAVQAVETQSGRLEGSRATQLDGTTTQLDADQATQLEGRQAGQLAGERAAQADGSQAGPLTRLFRWWLEHSLRYAEVVGAQWR